MSDDTDRPGPRYPLGRHHRDAITTKSGLRLSDLNLGRVLDGELSPDDAAVSAETLESQAGFARDAGYEEVARNLARAAEMTRIPSDEILEIYEALRPGRSSYYQLLSLSQQLSARYGAEHTGAYIREAAEVYRDTGLLKMDDD